MNILSNLHRYETGGSAQGSVMSPMLANIYMTISSSTGSQTQRYIQANALGNKIKEQQKRLLE